ncbi:MAG: DUF4132 domain-containing protein [Clostridiales bacterium]|nr:DUF4132 domain-containing protein [Clostridiales bacterium]
MEEIDGIIKLRGAELEAYSRSLFDDRRAFNEVIVSLARTGDVLCYEKIAEILSFAPIETGEGGSFRSADKREPKGKRFIDLFISCCGAELYPESEYIAVILGVRYAKAGSELSFWREGADAYLTDKAKSDFEFVASCVDRFDKKFASYDILLRVDRARAIDRLTDRLLNEKYFDKASARTALTGCTELVGTLIDLFDVSNAATRVKIARILLIFKNDHIAGEFIKEKRETDPSKTVRAVLSCATIRARVTDPVKFLESLMTTGDGISYAEFKEIERGDLGESFCAAADRLIFGGETNGGIVTLLYSDGRFYDANDRPVKLSDERMIFVLHPIDMERLCPELRKLDIEQPFLQVKRPVFYPSGQNGGVSSRIEGTMITRKSFDMNLKNSGFAFAADGEESGKTAIISIGDYALAIECGMPSSCDTVDAGSITFFRSGDLVKNNRSIFIGSAHPVYATAIPPVVYSELMYAAYKLFDCV